MTNETAGSETTAMTDESGTRLRRTRRPLLAVVRRCRLVPIPLVDVAAVGGVQLQMLRRLSEIYGVPFSENMGKSVIASLAGR